MPGRDFFALPRSASASVLLLLMSGGAAWGQEAVRMSLAGAEAARARRQAASTPGYYDVTLGPTLWKFGAGLGLEYSDNINLGAGASEGDFSFRPQLNTEMLWPLTDQNSLNFKVGVGYAAYLRHSELDRIFVTPGSELSFDVYTGDVWINLHDRFSITESAYQDPTVAGTGDYARLENAVGTSALWDLNKVILRAGYDHVDYIGLSTHGQQPDGQSELFSASAAYAIKPGMQAGIELGGGLLSYFGTNVAFRESIQWNVGSFFEAPVSDHMHFRASIGYTVYKPEATGTIGAGSEFSGVYAQVAITHRLNEYVDYTLSGGRSLSFALYGGSVDLYYARFIANWRIVEKVTIGTSLDFDHGTQVGFGSETFDRYGVGVTLGRAITTKLSGRIGYRFYRRESDLAGRDYSVNVVSLTLNYAF